MTVVVSRQLNKFEVIWRKKNKIKRQTRSSLSNKNRTVARKNKSVTGAIPFLSGIHSSCLHGVTQRLGIINEHRRRQIGSAISRRIWWSTGKIRFVTGLFVRSVLASYFRGSAVIASRRYAIHRTKRHPSATLSSPTKTIRYKQNGFK